MPVLFEGFPRLIDRTALKPGRWFMAAPQKTPLLCFSTDVALEEKPLVMTFGLTKPEQVEFAACVLSDITGPITSVEDELVFSPSDAADKLQLHAPARRPFPNGALLRLRNGDLGVGFVTKISRGVTVISLASGQRSEGFDLVFERWSLSIRRGQAHTPVGHFRAL
jgi:hypothetical protein